MAVAKSTGVKSQFEKEAEQARAALRQLGGAVAREEMIERGGTKISLPHGMSIKDGILFLKRVYDEGKQTANVHRVFRYRPKDGAHAAYVALRRAFGGVSTPPTMGFFGPNPPRFIDVEIGVGEIVQVPWDSVVIPHMPEVTFHFGSELDPDVGPLFVVTASGPKDCMPEIEAVFIMIREELEERSIYRGKAIDDGFGFIDTSKIDPSKVVYEAETLASIEDNIFARLEYPEILRELDQELKGSVLLEGKFGVGKTLTAGLTAQKAEKATKPWTFILVRPEQGRTDEVFTQAMQTARLYEPAVVFCEDVDRISSSDAETDRITVMLDVFDGARSKGAEILAILTTNHVDTIHKGMVRPGRIDAVIHIPAPDHAGIIKLCKTLVPESLLDTSITDEQWELVAESMDEYLPAFVAEACKRAVRRMVSRTGGEIENAKITAEDLILVGKGLRAQFELMEGAKDVPDRDKLASAFENVISPVTEEQAREAVMALVHPEYLSNEAHEILNKRAQR